MGDIVLGNGLQTKFFPIFLVITKISSICLPFDNIYVIYTVKYAICEEGEFQASLCRKLRGSKNRQFLIRKMPIIRWPIELATCKRTHSMRLLIIHRII